MKKCCLILLFIVSTSSSIAQIEIYPNHFYFELLGAGGMGSIQYERQIFKKTRVLLHGGLGAYYDLSMYYSGILGVTYLEHTKWENRFIEFGFSVSATPSETSYYSPDDIRNGLTRYMPHVGFRWYTKKQWVWRTSVLAVMEHGSNPSPWLGFSVGKNL
jgi:hypothetical protein